ncbi:MAG TPA: glycosyltransferase [Gammaproteobacteria bacterium]|nr:glycosyltransferase [Gammaproteobacteria bacterium]
MNLLHVTFDMHIGGTEQVIKNLVEATDKSMFNLSILCLEAPTGPFGEMLAEKGYQIDSIPRKEGFDLKLIYKIRKYIIEHNIDVLHCHQYTPWVYGALASILTGSKVIFTEHGRFYPDRSSWKRKYINPFLVKLTDHITAISKATKQALVDYEYIPASKITVIYNGIAELESDETASDRLRTKLSISADALILGTIARLDPIKNHRLLISAFAEIQRQHPSSILAIVGDGEMRSSLENQVKQLNISDNVVFTGFQANPVDYLQLMDIFLLPSLSEGTAMTLLEAMSLSKPCIVTAVGGNPEIVENKVNGLVTPSDDKDTLVTACDLLLEDRQLRKKLGGAGRAKFEEKFTVKSMIKNYQEIYQ